MEFKKIKIVGQPMYNIGDLAACKTLITLFKEHLNCDIELAFPIDYDIDPEFLKLDGVQFVRNIPSINKYEKLIAILSPTIFKFIISIISKKKEIYSSILNADFVLFSPGGLELGLYKSWYYLWLMAVLIAFNKNFGIYSRSIGDFRDKTLSDFVFKKQTIRFLKHSKFNGLRDLKSQQTAEQFKIPFYPAIDVVFSNIPDYKISEEIKEMIGKNYIVFTPSKFDWHHKLKQYSIENFFNIYLEIINILIEKTDKKIIMLPHIYKNGIDKLYFNNVKEKCIDSTRIIILEDYPNPDLYQKIISKAFFTIAARSHQIIFSINNKTPFLCLSYEHKMEDMLRILDLEEYSVRIQEVLDKKIDLKNLIIEKLKTTNKQNEELVIAQKKAQKIALSSFDILNKVLKTLNFRNKYN